MNADTAAPAQASGNGSQEPDNQKVEGIVPSDSQPKFTGGEYIDVRPTDASQSAPQQKSRHRTEEVKRLWKQAEVSKLYNGTKVQVFVAFLICTNFLCNMVEKEIDPSATKHTGVFEALDLCYNIAFTIELAVNLYSHWFRAFWRSGWNIFDTVVVSIGVINMLKLPLPPPFRLLRLMRAFRVFRLFKRIKSLNKIIVAIVHAVPGVINAFVILTIVMCIYAILAVEFFQDVGVDCKEPNFTELPGYFVGLLSIRKFCMGNEYFGSFSKSIYTFFQVLTGESWSEMVARPVIWYYGSEWHLCVGSALFFVSFVLVTAFVLINVVVAVLLDKMSSSEEEEEAEEAEEAEELREEEMAEEIANEASAANPAADPLTEQELVAFKCLHKLRPMVQQVTSQQADLQAEFARTRDDVAALKQQLGTLAQAINNVPFSC
jgi:hypothetical protein